MDSVLNIATDPSLNAAVPDRVHASIKCDADRINHVYLLGQHFNRMSPMASLDDTIDYGYGNR
jgi:hypothetical protein